MNKRQTYFWATIAAIVLVGGGYWLSAYFSAPPKTRNGGDIVLPPSLAATAADASESSDSVSSFNSSEAGWKTYQNQSPAFTFKYPPQYKIGTFADVTGQTILIQGSSDTLAQIFITPYADSPTITSADINASLPNLHVTDPQAVQVLGGNGVTFTSDNNLSTSTREIWFVRDSYIYEVSIPLAHEALVDENHSNR